MNTMPPSPGAKVVPGSPLLRRSAAARPSPASAGPKARPRVFGCTESSVTSADPWLAITSS
jgi:hypothetical protein